MARPSPGSSRHRCNAPGTRTTRRRRRRERRRRRRAARSAACSRPSPARCPLQVPLSYSVNVTVPVGSGTADGVPARPSSPYASSCTTVPPFDRTSSRCRCSPRHARASRPCRRPSTSSPLPGRVTRVHGGPVVRVIDTPPTGMPRWPRPPSCRSRGRDRHLCSSQTPHHRCRCSSASRRTGRATHDRRRRRVRPRIDRPTDRVDGDRQHMVRADRVVRGRRRDRDVRVDDLERLASSVGGPVCTAARVVSEERPLAGRVDREVERGRVHLAGRQRECGARDRRAAGARAVQEPVDLHAPGRYRVARSAADRHEVVHLRADRDRRHRRVACVMDRRRHGGRGADREGVERQGRCPLVPSARFNFQRPGWVAGLQSDPVLSGSSEAAAGMRCRSGRRSRSSSAGRCRPCCYRASLRASAS